MKRIPLRARDGTVRAYALVDDDDFEELAQYRWYVRQGSSANDQYAQRSVPRVTTVLMHRQIMDFPPCKVDHRDGDGLNNQRVNLRRATDALNAQNRRGADRDSQTGHRGVSPDRGKFRAQAMRNGINHRLGRFATPEEAVAVVEAFWASNDVISGG